MDDPVADIRVTRTERNCRDGTPQIVTKFVAYFRARCLDVHTVLGSERIARAMAIRSGFRRLQASYRIDVYGRELHANLLDEEVLLCR